MSTKALSRHQLVTSVSDERGNGDGIWCYLKPGYKTVFDDHAVHEDTVAECRIKLKTVSACDCEACEREIKRSAKH